VTGPLSIPLATGFTGLHARWLARVRPAEESTRAYLSNLLHDVSGLDLFDRAEIALAAHIVSAEVDAQFARESAGKAREFLTQLPPAVASFFATIGMLQEGRETSGPRVSRGLSRQAD
jgi:hypothetical protein